MIADGKRAMAETQSEPPPASSSASEPSQTEVEASPEPSGHRAPDVTVFDPAKLPANVLPFSAPAKPERRGRRKKHGDETLRVDYVKESRNTMTFRVRWKEADGSEPAVAVSRVNDQLFNSITKGKVKYAAFKKQLIASYLARAVRQGDGTDASAHRSV